MIAFFHQENKYFLEIWDCQGIERQKHCLGKGTECNAICGIQAALKQQDSGRLVGGGDGPLLLFYCTFLINHAVYICLSAPKSLLYMKSHVGLDNIKKVAKRKCFPGSNILPVFSSVSVHIHFSQILSIGLVDPRLPFLANKLLPLQILFFSNHNKRVPALNNLQKLSEFECNAYRERKPPCQLLFSLQMKEELTPLELWSPMDLYHFDPYVLLK